jgi:hypothetical protein
MPSQTGLQKINMPLPSRQVETSMNNHWHDTSRKHCSLPAPQQCTSLAPLFNVTRNPYLVREICMDSSSRFLHTTFFEDLLLMYLHQDNCLSCFLSPPSEKWEQHKSMTFYFICKLQRFFSLSFPSLLLHTSTSNYFILLEILYHTTLPQLHARA